jgi:hypothetical protein
MFVFDEAVAGQAWVGTLVGWIFRTLSGFARKPEVAVGGMGGTYMAERRRRLALGAANTWDALLDASMHRIQAPTA